MLIADHADRLVGEILGQVVAVGGRRGRFDAVVVADELGRPLVRVATEEPVVALEAEADRPPI
jgi:hypothetical protein